MRILILITRGELGGAQTHVLELCRVLAGKVDFLVLIGGKEKSALEGLLVEMGVKVERIGGLSNSLSPGRLFRGVGEARKKIANWRPDAVHVHSAVAGVVGRLAGWISNVPVVYTVHGFGFKPQVPWLRRTIVFFVEQALAPLTARIICVSRFEFDLAQRLFINKKRLLVISNGVTDVSLRANSGAEPAEFIMVARMDAPKRHDLLIRALDVLRKRGVMPPRVILAGGGPLMMETKALCKKYSMNTVEMPGDLNDMPSRLAACQVFVLLSDHEGQPISIIEAMRSGLPILASDLPGIREQVTHGVEGFLTKNNAEDVADILEKLIGSPVNRINMGQASRRRYELEFSAEKMARSVLGVYSDVAKIQS